MLVANQGSSRLRRLLENAEKDPVVAPGVYDGFTARLALAQGFKCLYMTGAGTSMSRLGLADLGLVTQTDMIANASMIASLDRQVPVIADADTGYGGPPQVARTTIAYAQAGVAGLHIEDQVGEKRCGHLGGKQLVPRDVWYARLRAAIQARDSIGSDMVIIARTDARAVDGFDEAIARLQGAVEVGVDALFLEALANEDEARQACTIFKPSAKPLLLNVVPKGVTPNFSVETAQKLGFAIIIFPTVCLEAVYRAGVEALKGLKLTGKQDDSAIGVRELFRICGLDELVAIDANAGGKAYGSI